MKGATGLMTINYRTSLACNIRHPTLCTMKWVAAVLLLVCLQSALFQTALAETTNDIGVKDVKDLFAQPTGSLDSAKCVFLIARDVVRLFFATFVDMAYCPVYVVQNLKDPKDDVLFTLRSVGRELRELLAQISTCSIVNPASGLYCAVKKFREARPNISKALQNSKLAMWTLLSRIATAPGESAFCGLQMIAMHKYAIHETLAKLPLCKGKDSWSNVLSALSQAAL